MPERASLRAGMLVPALFLTEEAGTGQWDTHQPVEKNQGWQSGMFMNKAMDTVMVFSLTYVVLYRNEQGRM